MMDRIVAPDVILFPMSNPNHEPAFRPDPLAAKVNRTTAFFSRLLRVGWQGLSEGSLLAQTLYYPDEDGQLTLLQAPAGRYSGYDTYGDTYPGDKKRNRIAHGRLGAFILSSVAGNTAGMRTPMGLASPLNYEALFYGSPYCSLNDLLAAEYLHTTTYDEAFRSIHLERYQEELVTYSIADNTVHQVTPKGNGLVFLLAEGGTPSRAGNRRAALEIAPRPIVAYQGVPGP